jgi:hypothetical protein
VLSLPALIVFDIAMGALGDLVLFAAFSLAGRIRGRPWTYDLDEQQEPTYLQANKLTNS